MCQLSSTICTQNEHLCLSSVGCAGGCLLLPTAPVLCCEGGGRSKGPPPSELWGGNLHDGGSWKLIVSDVTSLTPLPPLLLHLQGTENGGGGKFK